MTALEPVRRILLYGILSSAFAFAAAASDALVAARAPEAAVGAPLLDGDRRESSLQYVHWGRFCCWYRHHRLCHQLIQLRSFCDRHPDHRLCDDDDEDRFCRKHPFHRRCDDKPPSPS
jgi:hypothetical protein